MNRRIIIDTGPIVAFFNQKDYFSNWVQYQLKHLKPPFYTCEAVITEVVFLLNKLSKDASGEFLKLITNEIIKIDFNLNKEIKGIVNLIKKYNNIPMSLADACLVRMCEQHSNAVLFTCDDDFKIYRKHDRHILELCTPE